MDAFAHLAVLYMRWQMSVTGQVANRSNVFVCFLVSEHSPGKVHILMMRF